MTCPPLPPSGLSVLSVEPYGMKPRGVASGIGGSKLSVLSVEPYGMKLYSETSCPHFSMLSVLSVEPYGMKLWDIDETKSRPDLSVLSVEPYGMKQVVLDPFLHAVAPFSALGRAVWDETLASPRRPRPGRYFQCSRSSRMG